MFSCFLFLLSAAWNCEAAETKGKLDSEVDLVLSQKTIKALILILLQTRERKEEEEGDEEEEGAVPIIRRRREAKCWVSHSILWKRQKIWGFTDWRKFISVSLSYSHPPTINPLPPPCRTSDTPTNKEGLWEKKRRHASLVSQLSDRNPSVWTETESFNIILPKYPNTPTTTTTTTSPPHVCVGYGQNNRNCVLLWFYCVLLLFYCPQKFTNCC